MEGKYCRDSFVVKTAHVLPPLTNSHGTLFGGRLLEFIDDVGAISALRHARKLIVTASTDSVDFLHPIYEGNSVCLESFVTYAGRTSMEVFVRVIAEDLLTGERNLCALSFLTMVAIDENGKPTEVPKVIPQTEMEKALYDSAKERAENRKKRRKEAELLARKFGTDYPWKENIT
jgi:acyl-CoA hydrolase